MTPAERLKFVKVAVNAGRPNFMTFSYHVPPDRDVVNGEVVHVPWGRRKLQGVVVDGPIDMSGFPGTTRPLEPPVANAPVIPQHRRDLARWIADYYFAPQWESYALMLPPGAGERPRTSAVRGAADLPDALSERQQGIYELLSGDPRDLDELRDAVGRRGFDAAFQALVRRGLAEPRYSLARPRGRPRVAEVLRLRIEPDDASARAEAIEGRRSSRRARALSALLDAGEPRPLAELAKIARGGPAVETLISDGLLKRSDDGIALAITEERARREIRVLTRTREQAAAAAILDRLAAQPDEPLPLAGLARDVGAEARRAVAGLVTAGLVRIDEVLDRRDPLRDRDFLRREAPSLMADQVTAVAAITEAIDRPEGSGLVLQGVTGSGKTEVYLAALDHAVAQGKRGIVLVPEIALTPQTVRRFAERFPGRVGVLHSGISLGEAYDEWHAIEGGAYDVVIGSRSAIFAPQPDLGLIVIDEAHEWTYKQQDPSPRYDARTVALQLAETADAAVVLGSATPDAEQWYAGVEGPLELLELPNRVRLVPQPDGAAPQVWARAELPEVEIVDVRGSRSLFSDELLRGLAETLDRDEQAILFLNRRGLSGFLICHNGHSPACSSCDVSMTLHDAPKRLICHQCNRSRSVPSTCPECDTPLRQARAGTQRVVREVMKHFPATKVERWDRDTARRAEQHEEILGRFSRHEADVLVGTQMVAKGLDLPLVTFVGVVLADHGLREGDFRSRERTFQLLEQVSGRAGRAERDGRVVIQTMVPDDPAVQFAAAHDVAGFFEEELAWRALHSYPPFGRLVRLLFAHERAEYAKEEARRVHAELSTVAAGLPDVEVLGPSRPQVARVRGRHRWSLLIRGTDPSAVLREIELPPGWAVDVDPVNVG
ncbi:MAG TPA: primosomal protein N' [Dehalococcoidia bacterium]|nr:primosomal protein N' [Dehalococcoidia bacterium]